MKRPIRHALIYALVAFLAAVIALITFWPSKSTTELRLDEFEKAIADESVEWVKISDRDNRVEGALTDGSYFRSTYPREYAAELTRKLRERPSIRVEVVSQRETFWQSLIYNLIQWTVLIGAFALLLWFFIFRASDGGLGRSAFGKSRARRFHTDDQRVTFADVAGLDEAVEELAEIRDYLEAPDRFRELGAKVPKGVLLVGAPGTGKTLLARAVAGEANVPFFSISGSDFVEMFVGVGASRIRDLFAKAKAESPAIIFIDEIDAVGRQRGTGLGGGHDEREQTLNQLLVEMDGFDTGSGVVLMGATNRPDILDPALLRPGRFDRQVFVDLPDLPGRKKILEVHTRGKPLARDVDLEFLAKRTPGFTGADLANMVNEGALLAARRGRKEITREELDEAIDRVMAGPERKTRVISEHEKKVIAYHEAGHALVGHVLPNADPIHKISIIPRGRALGYTLALPESDRYLLTRSELRDRLATLMGGRVAEEMIFEEPTTGAQDDLRAAAELARQMVAEYGMSDHLGPISLATPASEVFLGRDYTAAREHSDVVAAEVDREVRRFVEEARDEAKEILVQNREVLDRLASELIAKETLDTEEVRTIFEEVPTWRSGESRTTDSRERESQDRSTGRDERRDGSGTY